MIWVCVYIWTGKKTHVLKRVARCQTTVATSRRLYPDQKQILLVWFRKKIIIILAVSLNWEGSQRLHVVLTASVALLLFLLFLLIKASANDPHRSFWNPTPRRDRLAPLRLRQTSLSLSLPLSLSLSLSLVFTRHTNLQPFHVSQCRSFLCYSEMTGAPDIHGQLNWFDKNIISRNTLSFHTACLWLAWVLKR